MHYTKKKFITRKFKFDYYIYIDYSENLIGYIVIHEEKINEILPRISKFSHYKKIKYKRQYLNAIKKIIIKNNINSLLLKCRIEEVRSNILIFTDILEFIKRYDNCGIFISVDNNQYNAFIRLFKLVPHKKHIVVIKESYLNKDSIEYKLSLIIDNLINIKRIRETSK